MIKHRLLFVCLLLWAHSTPVWAQGSVVQSAVDGDANPWETDGLNELVFSGDTTIGNVVAVAFSVGSSNRSVSSAACYDNGSATADTLSLVMGATAEIAANAEGWIYAVKTTAVCDEVRVQISSACACAGEMVIVEIGNTTASPIEDGAGAASSVTTTHDSGNVTLAGDGVLFGCSFRTGVSFNGLDAQFTALLNVSGGICGYDVAAAGDHSITNTTAANQSAVNILVAITANTPGGGGGIVIGGGIIR